MIPWVLSDSNFAKNVTQKLDSSKTVFVGGLHGMINAGLYSKPILSHGTPVILSAYHLTGIFLILVLIFN